MKELYRRNKSLITVDWLTETEAVMIVFLCTAHSQAVHNGSARIPIEESVLALLKDLPHQLPGKP
jgi:hypothetical protein